MGTANNSTIPPIRDNDNLVTDPDDKANMFNDFFQTQTILNDSTTTIPVLPPYVGPELSNISVTSAEVRNMIGTLSIGKASGPDSIGNKILKETADSISEPLGILFNNSLRTGQVPAIWKLANVSPVFKKDDPSLLKNYRPISLLSTIGKLLEKIIHRRIYNFFLDNDTLTSLQSGFIMGDSTVYQLTDLYNTFCSALDAGKEVRSVFCDISKAFDRVWHTGLILKLQHVGITGPLLDWFKSYLTDRTQRVVLPGAASLTVPIKAGVPQGSILGPLLFLVFINDIVTVTRSPIRLFADDTSLYLIVNNPDTAATQLNSDLIEIQNWAKTWLVTFNPDKTQSLIFSRKRLKPQHPPLLMNNTQISEVNSHKHLGLYLSSTCDWHAHIEYIVSKATQRINIMRKFKFILDRKSLEKMYFVFIRPLLEYGDIIWNNCTEAEKNELDKLQNEAARIATGATKLISIAELYKETGWERLSDRRSKHKLIAFYKMVNNLSPNYLSDLVPPRVGSNSNYSLRNSDDIQQIRFRSKLYGDSFLPSVVLEWNKLSHECRNADSIRGFKHHLNQNNPPRCPSYYYFGKREAQVLHSRLRTRCCALNAYLHRCQLVYSPLCECGSIESIEHYLLSCPRYNHIRQTMLETCTRSYGAVSAKLLLYGDPLKCHRTNCEAFSAVHSFIITSSRFQKRQT